MKLHRELSRNGRVGPGTPAEATRENDPGVHKKKWLSLIPGLFLLGCSPESLPPREPRLVLNSVRIVDVEQGDVLDNRTVVIESDRITEIHTEGVFQPEPDDRIIEGDGLYAIPGLWDMHMHMVNDVSEAVPWDFHSPGPGNPEQREIYLPSFLAFGVTGTRELSGGLASIELRERIRHGELLGPHMVVGSPLLDGPVPSWPTASVIAIDGPEAARKVVSELHAQGFDFLKTYNLLSAESYRAIQERAKELGMEVSGEIPIGVSVREAAELGHRTIEHLTGMEFACSDREQQLRESYVARIEAMNENPESDKGTQIWLRSEWEPYQSYSAETCSGLYRDLAHLGTWVVPTLQVQYMISYRDQPGVIDNPDRAYLLPRDQDFRPMADALDPDFMLRAVHDHRLTSLADIHGAGIGIMTGSDQSAGFVLHEELQRFVEAGLTPLEALRTATLNPARYLGRDDELGSIAAGKIADIVLIRGNPLEEISHIQDIEAVIFQGHLLNRSMLDRMLQQLQDDSGNHQK